MNQVFQGYAHKAIVGLLAMASMLLFTVSCGDGSAPAKFDLPKLSYTPLSAPFGIGESASPQWEGDSTEPTASFTMAPAAGGSLPAGIDIDEKTGIVSVSGTAAKQDETDYTVTLTGTGDYTGTAAVTISIAVISLSAAELDRGTDEYRGHYSSFSMDSGHEAFAGDYRLALRSAAAAEPGAADIRAASATIVRTLSTTSINVFMSFHMDTDLFDAAADWTQSPYSGGSHALSNARVNTAVLQNGTAYALYAVKADGADDMVHKLLEFTTDSATPSAGIKGMPQAVHTIRNGEPFLLQAYVQASSLVDFRMDLTLLVTLSDTDSDNVLIGPLATGLKTFYSSNVPKNEYAMLSKSIRTGFTADKSAGENLVFSVVHAGNTVSSTFVIQ